MKHHALECRVCKNPFLSPRAETLYCSNICRIAYHKELHPYLHRPNPHDLATGTIGMMNQFLVQFDLIRRGYIVFPAASTACLCDIVILGADNTAVRVESRTGGKRANGSIHYQNAERDKGRQDLFAVVVGNADIYYFAATDRCPEDLRGAITTLQLGETYGDTKVSRNSTVVIDEVTHTEPAIQACATK